LKPKKIPGTDLDFKRVEKYVRRSPALLIPTGWMDWPNGRPPSQQHKLAIDDELARLSSGRKRILSADEVRARYSTLHWPSHELVIRSQLVWYVNFEFINSRAADAELAQFLTRQLRLLKKSEDSLIDFHRRNAGPVVQFYSPLQREMTAKVQSALEQIQKLKLGINWCFRERRPSEGGRPIQNWKRQFVLRLAAFWQVIANSQPSTSVESRFAKFVSAAWKTLCPDDPDMSWDTAIEYSRGVTAEEAVEIVNLAATYVGFVWPHGVSSQNPR
jgi:hypothetical protein